MGTTEPDLEEPWDPDPEPEPAPKPEASEAELAAQLAECRRQTREQYAKENHDATLRRVAKRMPSPRLVAVKTEAELAEIEERRKADALRREQERIEGLALQRKQRGIDWSRRTPPRFAEACLEALDPDVGSQIQAWLQRDDTGGNLILVGPVGSGKTFAAYAVARSFYLDRCAVVVRSLAKFLDDLRPGPDSAKAMENAIEADLLVLDDWGIERKTDWTDERLHLVIDERWQWKRPVVITTNIEATDLPDALGERMFSRLAHGAVIVGFGGVDRRHEPAKERQS